MAFGRRLDKNKDKAQPGSANPSPRFQANDQPAKPQTQPFNPLPFRPPPIPTQRHDAGNHVYTTPPATTFLPSPGWGQSTALNYRTQVTTESPGTWQEKTVQGPTLSDLIASKFDSVLTSIDGEAFNGDERELGAQIDRILQDSLWLTYR